MPMRWLFLIVLLLSSDVLGKEEKKYFLGVETGNYTQRISTRAVSDTVSVSGVSKSTGTIKGIKFGVWDERGRAFFAYQELQHGFTKQKGIGDSLEGETGNLISVHASSNILDPSYPVNLLLGINTGLYYRNVKGFFPDGGSYNVMLATGGFQAGLVVNVLSVQIEGGGRIMVGTRSYNNWKDVRSNLDYLSQGYVGVNVSF